MTAFDEIQQLWNQQPLPLAGPQPETVIKAAERKLRIIKTNHLFTMGLLTATMLVLIAYFLLYGNFTFNRFFTGLLLMIGSLLLRVVSEYVSYRKFGQIDVHADFTTYTDKVTHFYKGRIKIHYYLTPMLLLLYFTGFVILLPIFKQVFSHGFYLYIIVSGAVICLAFVWLIARQVKKEMRLLDFLKGVKTNERLA